MPLPAIYPKRPAAIKNFGVIWADWLDEDETIVTSVWSIPAGITDHIGDGGSINLSPVELNGVEYRALTTATIWLAAGTVPDRYEVENTITTSAGRTEVRSIFIQMVKNY